MASDDQAPVARDRPIGEGSRFHEEFGYCAQGVDERTVILPQGWRDRLIRIQTAATDGRTGLCLEVHHLAISKYVAGRDKDLEFTAELARHVMVDPSTLRQRLRHTDVSPELRAIIQARIRRDFHQ